MSLQQHIADISSDDGFWSWRDLDPKFPQIRVTLGSDTFREKVQAILTELGIGWNEMVWYYERYELEHKIVFETEELAIYFRLKLE